MRNLILYCIIFLRITRICVLYQHKTRTNITRIFIILVIFASAAHVREIKVNIHVSYSNIISLKLSKCLFCVIHFPCLFIFSSHVYIFIVYCYICEIHHKDYILIFSLFLFSVSKSSECPMRAERAIRVKSF